MNKIKAPQQNCSRLLVISQYSSSPSSEKKFLNFKWTPWLLRIKTIIPALLTARYGHMVKSWPVKHKNSVLCWTSRKCPKEKEQSSLISSSLLECECDGWILSRHLRP